MVHRPERPKYGEIALGTFIAALAAFLLVQGGAEVGRQIGNFFDDSNYELQQNLVIGGATAGLFTFFVCGVGYLLYLLDKSGRR